MKLCIQFIGNEKPTLRQRDLKERQHRAQLFCSFGFFDEIKLVSLPADCALQQELLLIGIKAEIADFDAHIVEQARISALRFSSLGIKIL